MNRTASLRARVAAVSEALPLMPAWRNYRNPVQQQRQEMFWLALRQRSIGSSDIASVLGVDGAYSSRYAMWWAKQPGAAGGVEPREQTEEQEWGHRLEAAISAKFAERHPELEVIVPPSHMYGHPAHQWATCTPDRLAFDPDGELIPVELKTDQNPARWGDDPPELYDVQLLWQCAVLGVRRGYLAALVGKKYREYLRVFTVDEINETLRAGVEFQQSLAGDPPEVDGHRETRATLMSLSAAVDRSAEVIVGSAVVEAYESAHTTEKTAKAALKLAENQLRAAMGSSGTALDVTGRKIATRLQFKNPGYTVAPFEVDQIRRAVVKAKETRDA